MAAATATAIIGGASAAYSIYDGIKKTNEAKRALNDFDRQELNNVFEDVPISTYGSDLIREQSGLNSASMVDASRGAGIRGVFGAMPKIQAQTNRDNQQAASLIDQQVMSRNNAIATDNQRIQGMQEQRDNAELAGIGQQLNVGQQNLATGIRGLANAGMYAANNIDWNGDGTTGADSGIATGSMNDSTRASFDAYQTRKMEEELFYGAIPKAYKF